MTQTQMKPISKECLDLMLEWRNHPDIRKNMYTTHIISKDEHHSWFESIQNNDSKEYFIFYRDNTPSGIIGFTDIDTHKLECTWAFYANPEAVRGTGSLMEFHAIEYVFNNKKLQKLNCEVLAFNKPVIKLHTKFGFEITNTVKNGHFDGEKYHDIVQLSLTPDLWLPLKEVMAKKLRI